MTRCPVARSWLSTSWGRLCVELIDSDVADGAGAEGIRGSCKALLAGCCTGICDWEEEVTKVAGSKSGCDALMLGAVGCGGLSDALGGCE